ncbi:MAG: hypothetical protein EA417_04665 [Gammaproteobacteria bacterium]|nr:MAG: hypothetical protein EA417_04665 [Gammaproteobacteria bacterium]
MDAARQGLVRIAQRGAGVVPAEVVPGRLSAEAEPAARFDLSRRPLRISLASMLNAASFGARSSCAFRMAGSPAPASGSSAMAVSRPAE